KKPSILFRVLGYLYRKTDGIIHRLWEVFSLNLSKYNIASNRPPAIARDLSEIEKQCSRTARGSISPTFIPILTGNPSRTSPRNIPEIAATTDTDSDDPSIARITATISPTST